jgi:hypothetical protein
MHTCAHHPSEPLLLGVDLANGPDQSAHLLMCTGTLARDAEVRTKPHGPHGDPAPVLCLDLLDVVPHTSAVHVEQVFAPTNRRRAEQLASRLKKGMRVTARCLMRDVRLSMTAAFAIEAIPVPPAPKSTPKHP